VTVRILDRPFSHLPGHVFVFGSNLLGIHGAGAALYALKHCGAVSGRGEGLHGSSYALPTKRSPYSTMRIAEVKLHAEIFIAFAREHPELYFELTRIACGRAGYTDHEIAPFFWGVPDNVLRPYHWMPIYPVVPRFSPR
jgi:hypothetical protein